MPTIIDSLIVTLSLESKDIEAKASVVSKKLQDINASAEGASAGVASIGKASRGAGEGLGVVTSKLTSFLAILGGTAAVGIFVKDAINANTQLYYLSRSLDMSAKSLFAFGAAGQEMGIGKLPLQEFAASIKKIPGELLAGQTPALFKLGAMVGVDVEQTPEEVAKQLAQRFKNIDPALAFGFGTASGVNPLVMQWLLLGPHKVAEGFKTSRFAPDQTELKTAANLTKQIQDLRLHLTKLGYDLLQQAAPALEKLIALLNRLADWGSSHPEIVNTIGAIALGVAGLGVSVKIVTALASAFGGLFGILKVIGAFLVDNPIGAAIVAIAGAVPLLVQDYRTFKKGGKSEFNWDKDISAAKHTLSKDGPIAMQARHFADKVSAATGIAADWIFAQWSHETGNFTNRGATQLHNLAGINVPGGRGADYRDFPTFESFADYYTRLLKNKYPDTLKAHTVDEFAKALKAGGYYSDSVSNYERGMNSVLNGMHGSDSSLTTTGGGISTVLNGVSGASSSIASVPSSTSVSNTHIDNSTSNHIQTLNVNAPPGFNAPSSMTSASAMNLNLLLTQSNGAQF